MSVDEVIDRALDIGMSQDIDDDLSFPRAIGFWLPMLNGAAATRAEIRTKRFDPLGTGTIDAHKLPAIGVARQYTGFDGLAAERVRYKYSLAFDERDTIAAMADVIDGEEFSHAGHR
jgi:hypothetical protein